ncbi:MAG: hypothetical protein WC554_18680, partial [Clostridia bacterium]
MKHELKNSMFDIIRARADREHRELLRAMRENDELNAKFDRFVESIREALEMRNRPCDMVLPGQLPERRDRRQGNPDGERKAIERFGDDVCGMEHTVRAQATREELSQRSHG